MPEQDRLAANVQYLLDVESIKQLKYRYIRLVDAHRFEEWGKQCLTDDCYLSTTDLGTAQGRANIVELVARSYGAATTIHNVHMPEIVITGPHEASGVWSIDDYSTWVVDGARMAELGRGRYDELYVRTEEGWRIKRSVLVREALGVQSSPATRAASAP
jgi:hypothetical protein